MNTYEIQFAWFFVSSEETDYESLVSDIRKASSKKYLSPATYMPLPLSAQAELPRVQLLSIDQKTRINISLNRMDIFISAANTSLETSEISDFYTEIDRLSAFISKEKTIQRLGIVYRQYVKNADPEKHLSERLLSKDKVYKNLNEVAVKITERKNDGDIEFNDTYYFESGIHVVTGEKIIVIMRDVNTPQEITNRLSYEKIYEFIAIGKKQNTEDNINVFIG